MIARELAVAVAIAIVGLAGKISWNKKEKEKKQEEERQRKEQLKKEIKNKINDLKKEFKKEALSYSLEALLLDSSLPREKKKELLSQYEEVLSQPRVKWDNFTITGEEGDVLDELLEEEIKDFSEKDNYTIKDSFKFMLLEESEEEAKKKIANYQEKVKKYEREMN